MSLSDLNQPEVDYARSALRTVVCQLKFNPILRIAQELPARFQDRVRHELPNFYQEAAGLFTLSPTSIEALPMSSPVWRFRSDDEHWIAGLSVDFISLETTRYLNFPDFFRRFAEVLTALRDSEDIARFTRVGLRYINIFTGDQYPGGWATRFEPHIVGPLADKFLGDHVAAIQSAFVVADEHGSVTVRHGLKPDGEFLLDIDSYVDRHVEPDDVEALLLTFNRRAYQLFRWSISEQLHLEMEPTARHE